MANELLGTQQGEVEARILISKGTLAVRVVTLIKDADISLTKQ